MANLDSPLHPETPIVVFGDDWGRSVSTMQHTFRHIATTHPVVWINGIGHRIPELNLRDLARAWGKVRARLRPQAAPPPPADLGGTRPQAILEPSVLPWHNIKPVHVWNTRVIRQSIKACLDDLGLRQRPLLVTGSPPSVGVVGDGLEEIASIYYCMDDFLHHPDATASMIGPLEERLLDRVDAMVATAKSLTETKVPATGRVFHLPQGVNYDHFARERPEPAEMAAIPGPRIGFAGGVNDCCDFELIAEIARTMPDASVVLVGPLLVEKAVLREVELPNVHVLGPKPYQELPAYVQHFDVGIVPYLLNDWTRAVDPLKLLEYMAAGLPVVSTDLPESSKYAPPVRVAATRAEFIAAVKEALSSGSNADGPAPRDVAKSHTWERRAQQFLDIVGTLPLESGAS